MLRHRLRWEWIGAQADIARALELDPNDALTLRNYAAVLLTLGRADEAIAAARKATQLDPLSEDSWTQLGRMLAGTHANIEAREALERALSLNPRQNWANFMLGHLLLSQGEVESAMSHFALAPEQFRTTGTAMVEFTRGNEAASKAALARLEKEFAIGFAFQIAQVYAWRGEKDQAFEWLERSYAIHDAGLARLPYDPAVDPLRSDPRFAALVERMGFPK